MNKDALLATIIGFGIGLIITSAFLFGPSILKSLPNFKLPQIALALPEKTQPMISPTPAADDPTFKVTIDSPIADEIEYKSEVLISGIAKATSLVVIEGPVDEAIVTASQDGKYAGKITLSEGLNDVVVTSYGQDKQAKAQVQIYYTPEEF